MAKVLLRDNGISRIPTIPSKIQTSNNISTTMAKIRLRHFVRMRRKTSPLKIMEAFPKGSHQFIIPNPTITNRPSVASMEDVGADKHEEPTDKDLGEEDNTPMLVVSISNNPKRP